MQSKSKTKTRFPSDAKGSPKYKDLKQPERDINKQLQFQKLISKISSEFINLPDSKIDDEIEHSIQLVAEHFGIDRIALLQFSEDTTELHLTHTYAIDQRKRAPLFLVSEQLPWFSGSLRSCQTLRIKRTADMPEEAIPERKYVEEQGIKSFVTIPMIVAGSSIGAISYSSTERERDWPDDIVKQLRVVSELFTNALSRKQTGESIDERLRFEMLISELSGAFINLPADKIGERIDEALKIVAETLDIDRSLLHEFSEDKLTLRLSHFYVGPGIKKPTSLITSKDQPYLTKTILENEIIGIKRIDDLSEAAKLERKYLMQQGVKSALAIPLVVDNKPLGALTFTTVYRERSWPDELVQRLKLVSEIFANALDRKRKEQNLQNAFSEIKILKDQIQQENIYLRKEFELKHEHAEIVGNSKAINEALRLAEQVAGTESTVLILGETGTGKELLARAVHRLSSRSDRTMIKVNCAALPPTLIEGELFGREKGAYTGAMTREAGRFELADGSTLFLDEVSELPLELQSKLLRVLQDGEFERLGSAKTLSVDVRIVVATNRDLVQMVRDGKFREDLYYRLNVFPIKIPPLRERMDDIPALAWAFVKEFETTMAKRIESISRKSMQALQHYPWPGNVRELRNVIEQAMIISREKVLTLRIPNINESINPVDLKLEDVVRNHIVQALEISGWRVKGKNGAAELLGIKPTTLYSKINRMGIKRSQK